MSDLELQAQAQQHFGFLTAEKGYKCTESTPFRVRFESPAAFVELVFDGIRSCELSLLIGKNGSANPPFSIDELLRLRRAPEAERFSLVQVTSNDALASFVAQFAEMLRKHGESFIAGDEQSFAELAEQRRREIQTYALERDLLRARTEADMAWRKMDYATVAKVLKPFRAALTAAEAGKLEFAERQDHNVRDRYLRHWRGIKFLVFDPIQEPIGFGDSPKAYRRHNLGDEEGG